VALIRDYGLDGFDIDDEEIGKSSGKIEEADFNGVIQNLRNALDAAGDADGKTYYLTITPGFGAGNVTKANMANFDLINAQCYGLSYPRHFTALDYPEKQIARGVSTERTVPNYPTKKDYEKLAGIFNWSMSADSARQFQFTKQIAKDVGYHGGPAA